VKTAVFGGSFDPPHNGHLALCLFAREFSGLDRLIVSVSKNPFKAPADASDDDRAAMARLFVAELNAAGKFAEMSDWELQQPGPSYTIDLLRHVAALHQGDDLVLLVGEDSYQQMPQWRESQAITKHCDIAVFGRSSGELASTSCGGTLPPAMLFDFDMPVSATEVRRLAAAGQPIGHLVPPSIAEYIESHGLYRA
jgi:nicotinate-nucleotide adenylyltransferase